LGVSWDFGHLGAARGEEGRQTAVLEELGDRLLADLGMYKPQAGQIIHNTFIDLTPR